MSKIQLVESNALKKIQSIYNDWHAKLLDIINNNQEVRENYKELSIKESEEYVNLLNSTSNAMNTILQDKQSFVYYIDQSSEIDSLLRVMSPAMTNEFTLHLLIKFISSDFFESRNDIPILIRAIIQTNAFVQNNLNKYDPITECNIAELLLPIIATNIHAGDISVNLNIFNIILNASLNLEQKFRGDSPLASLATQNLYEEVVRLFNKNPNLKIDANLPEKIVSNFYKYPQPFYSKDLERSEIFMNGNQINLIGVSPAQFSSKYKNKIHMFLDQEGKSLGIEYAVKILKKLCEHGLKIDSNLLITSNNIKWTVNVNGDVKMFSNIWMDTEIMSIDGFDPNTKNNHGNPFLFSILQQSSLNKDFSLAYKLINHEKFDATILADSGHSYVHAVCAFIQDLDTAKQLIKMLITKGVQLNNLINDSQTFFNYIVTKLNEAGNDTIKKESISKIASHIISLDEFNPNLSSTGKTPDGQTVFISDILLALEIGNQNIIESFIKNTKFNSLIPIDSTGCLITNAIITSLPKEQAKNLLEILVKVKGCEIVNAVSILGENTITLFNFLVSQMKNPDYNSIRKAELLEMTSYVISLEGFNPNLVSTGKTPEGEIGQISDVLLALQMLNKNIIDTFINNTNLSLDKPVDKYGTFIIHAIITLLPEEMAKDYINILMQKNPSIINTKTQNKECFTPFLSSLISQKSIEFLDFLKNSGANLNIKQLSGVSATHIAAGLGRKDYILWLHQNDAFTFDPISRLNDTNPSEMAYKTGHIDLAENIKYLAFLDAIKERNEGRKKYEDSKSKYSSYFYDRTWDSKYYTTDEDLKKQYGIDINYIPTNEYLKNIALSLDISIPNLREENTAIDIVNLDSLSINNSEDIKIAGDTTENPDSL